MYSIGTLSRQTGVKVPTIRYYEQMGLIQATGRTSGNQRRFGEAERERLAFIRHARDLGFSIEAIRALIALGRHPEASCAEVTEIAEAQLADVRARIDRLRRLEAELARISALCAGDRAVEDCHVFAALADHAQCETEH